ncbi:MAG: hypothetical protein Q8O84_00045 [Nanoarchaeota archaeon]|nr:hypothetical protein [Nanoarchaeota archaeon]
MKNLSIWIITLIAVIVLLVGIFSYGILGAVVNAAAFIISLTIILLILILVIIFSQQDNRKKIPRFEPRVEIMENDAPEKKLKTSKKRIVEKVSKKK